MLRQLRTTGLFLGIVLMGGLTSCSTNNTPESVVSRFESLKPEMTKAEVIAILGEPIGPDFNVAVELLKGGTTFRQMSSSFKDVKEKKSDDKTVKETLAYTHVCSNKQWLRIVVQLSEDRLVSALLIEHPYVK